MVAMLTAHCEGASLPIIGKLVLTALLGVFAGVLAPLAATAQSGVQRSGSTFSSISRDDELKASSGDVRQRFTDVVARGSDITRRTFALQQRQQRIEETMNRLQPPSCSAIEKLHWSGSYSCAEDNTEGDAGGTEESGEQVVCNPQVVIREGNAPSYVAIATCPVGSVLVGGGGGCDRRGSGGADDGFLHASFPDGRSWTVDCFEDKGRKDTKSTAYAICCRK